MRFSENRAIAWIVLTVCVVGSIIGLGGSGIAGERSRLVDLFYDGADKKQTTRYSMDAYLDRSLECAQEMAYEAQLNLGTDNRDAQKMLDLLADFGNDDDLDTRYAAYEDIQKYSDILYNAVYAADLTDQQRVNFKTAYDDFWGYNKYILRDPYREKAADFNRDLRGFPAKLVSGLMGVEELNTFGA